MASSYKYKAFISYSHRDEKWASWLHRSLESYRVPKRIAEKIGQKRIGRVFRDRDELPSSPDLSEKISRAMEQSENLLVICSPAAALSSWVDKEIIAFKKLGRSDRIHCLVVDGEFPSSFSDYSCFPPALFRSYDNSGEPADRHPEPIAADARKDADGKAIAKLKIIAGILNVDLDDLRCREIQRRNRRYMLVTGTSLIAAVFTLFLAVNAIVARNESNQRRQQAENLLSYMVGDLRDSLAPIGRLDLLEDVAENAMQYFAAVNINSLSDNELLRQSEVLTQLGQIQLDQFNYAGATESFEEAYRRSSVLYTLNPLDSERLFHRGQAEYWVGFVHFRTGLLENALSWMERYRTTSEQLVRIEPERDDYKRELGYAYHNLAVIADENGDKGSAKTGFEYLLMVLEDLEQRDHSLSIKKDISETVSWLGDVEYETGNLARSLDYHQRSRQIMEDAWAGNRNHSIVKERLAVANRRVARIEEATGKPELARVSYQTSIDLFSELIAADNSNQIYHQQLAATRIRLAQLLLLDGNSTMALELIGDALNALEDMKQREVNDVFIQSELAFGYLLSARIAHMNRNPEGALQQSEIALELLSDIKERGRLTDFRAMLLARVLLDRAACMEYLELHSSAWSALAEAKTVVDEFSLESDLPELLATKAQILRRLGNIQEANQVWESLSSRNYVSQL